MKERLENILRKLVLPLNDRLVDVKVTKKNNQSYYYITFMINDRIDYSDGYIIEREVNSLFDMLSPEEGESFIIGYHSVSED